MSEQIADVTFHDNLAPDLRDTIQQYAISPVERFRQHVDYIRAHGDALDATSSLESFKKSQLSYAIGTAVASHFILMGGESYTSPTGLVICGSMGTMLFSYLHSARRKDINNKLHKTQDLEAQSTLQEYYELWRVPNDGSEKNDIVMHWQGAYDNEVTGGDLPSRTLPRSVHLIAKLANENDVKAVIVAPETLATVPNAAAFATTEVDLVDWASRKKEMELVVTDDDAVSKHPVLVFTPEQFTLLADHINKNQTLPPDIYSYVEILRGHNADHPLVKTYDTYISTPELLPPKLRRVAKSCLERRLQDVAAIRSYDTDGSPMRDKIHLSGEFTGSNTINWHNQGRHYEMTDLQSAMNMTLEQATEIVKAPQVYGSTKVIEAAEMLLAIKHIELEEQKSQDENVAPLVDHSIMHVMARGQLRTGDFRNKVATYFLRNENDWRAVHPTKRRRIIAAWGFLAIVGAGLGANEWEQFANTTYEREVSVGQHDYARLNGIRVEALTEQQKNVIAKHLSAEHPITSSYHQLRENEKAVLLTAATAIADKLGNTDDSGGNHHKFQMQSNMSSMSSSIGNVPDPSDMTPLWQVKAADMSRTEGYWTSNIGYTLNLQGTWTSKYAKRQETAVLFPLKPYGLDETSLIRVQGRVHLDNESSFDDVPVLQGTHIVAGDLDGTPVGAEKFSDGTYKIISDRVMAAVPRIHGGTLTYWLKFDEKGAAIHKPVSQMRLKGDGYYGIPRDGGYFPELRQEWEKRTGINDDATDKKRLEAETSYVKDMFTYKFKPLSEKMTESMERGEFSPIDFSRTQLKEGTANCNVAATLVALDNPSAYPTWGFMNDGDTELTANERHMWLTDSEGKLYDPTPTKMAPEPMPNASVVTFESLLGNKKLLGSIALLGLVGALRRPIRKTHARAALSRATAQDLGRARRTLDTALYAKQFSVSTQPTVPTLDKQAQLAALSSPTYHDDATAARLRELRRQTNGANKAAVDQAWRILKHIRRSRPIRAPHVSDDVYGVL